MNLSEIVKSVGCFLVEGPDETYITGQPVTLIKGHKIRMNHVKPPRIYIAKSTVSFILTGDSDQLDKIPALELIGPELLTNGPKLGETWRRKIQHSSDETYNFACQARDDRQDKWFVWHIQLTGEAFVISKDDFFADRNNWEREQSS